MIRLFNVSIPPAIFILLIFEILLLSGSFFLATVAFSDLDPADYLLNNYGAIALLLVVFSFLVGMHFQDLYTEIRVKSRVLLVQKLCMVTGTAFLAQGLISYLDSDLRVSVPVMLLGSAIAMPCIFGFRIWFGNVANQMIGHTRLVVAGQSPTLLQLRKWIDEHPEAGLVIEAWAESPADWKAMGEVVRKQQPPKVVFGTRGEPDPALAAELVELQLAGYEVEAAATTYEAACSRISLYSLRPEELIYSSAFEVTPQQFFYQLVFSGIIAGICFVVTLPVLLLTAALLKTVMPGPVWLSEPRVGLDGRIFRLYRFKAGGSSVVARVVRKLRLHALPQLLNVLKGDMAIVGPCADRPEFLKAIEPHIPFYRERYAVRPGITGWAQIHLNPSGEVEDTMARLEYDLYYIKHMSLGLDTLILLHTLKSMLMSPSAPARVWAGEQVSSASTN